MWISNCKKSVVLNMEKTYDFVIKLPGNHGKHIFFFEIEMVTTKIGNSKSLKKNLSSASVDDERP